MFNSKYFYQALFVSSLIGISPIMNFFLFGKVLNHIQRFLLLKRVKSYINQGITNTEVISIFPDINNSSYTNDHLVSLEKLMSGSYSGIMAIIIGFIVLSLVISVIQFFHSSLWIRIGAEITFRIRSMLFQSFMHLDITFFDNNPIGKILTYLSDDVVTIQNTFSLIKGTQIKNLTQFISGIGIAMVINWKMTMTSIIIIPFIAIIVIWFSRYMTIHEDIHVDHRNKSMVIAQESISQIKTVHSFNGEKFVINKFIYETDKSADHERIIGFFLIFRAIIIDALVWGMITAIFYFGAKLVETDNQGSGKFGVGDLVSVFGFCMFGCLGLYEFQYYLPWENRSIAAGERIFNVINQVPEQMDGKIPENDIEKIEFRNVSFKYPTREEMVLNNVSFSVKSGESIALVGHSGSGKSSCVQLLERYYEITNGSILINDIPIQEINPKWLRSQLGLVSQESILFNLSIRDNIAYGSSDLDDLRIENSAKEANAWRFIQKNSEGLNRIVGERGSLLSGGQRQRISIARAIYKQPKVFIADEATSALDTKSELKVQNALNNIMKNRTSIIIAHRLNTIKNAHKILVFDKGSIVEEGTHDELSTQNGAYYHLFKRQIFNDNFE